MGDTAEEHPEMLVTRRSKRSTAGNRMEAALAEMALDDTNKDLDDDNDFVNDKDEEDIFGSDFESTDEEAEKQANEAGEHEVINEERMIKRAARTRLEKITAAAHAKNKASFNPDIQLKTATKPKLKPKPKPSVVVGLAIDADSADVVAQSKIDDFDGSKRTSQRKHTIQNTSATVTRLKQVQAKRAAQPKKAKVEYKTYTQGELIALALDTEEGNIVDHRDYLKNEAEKRKRARVVRTTVEGPLLRWISKKEEVKVEIPPPPPPIPEPAVLPQIPAVTTRVFSPATVAPTPAPAATPAPAYAPSSTIYRSVYGPPGNLFTPTTYSYTAGMAVVSTNATTIPQTQSNSTPSTYPQTTTTKTTTTTFSHYQPYTDPAAAAFPTWPPPTTTQPSIPSSIAPSTSSTVPAPVAPTVPTPTPTPILTASATAIPDAATPQAPTSNPVADPVLQQPTATSQPLPLPPPPEPPEPPYRLETVTKNYVVHELAQQKGTPKPTWAQSMQAMFGDHVKWDQVKVFVGKGRPLSRPRQLCPITGRQAHYLDPRSGVPYADAYAYRVLTDLLNHEFVWDTELACYLNRETPPSGDADNGEQDLVAGGSGDKMEVDDESEMEAL